MKIIFLGNGEYGCSILSLLLKLNNQNYNYNVKWVVTNKDKWTKKIIKTMTNVCLPIVSSSKFKTEQIVSQYLPSLIICASFGQIITPKTIELTNNKCFNFHPSLLPKYRGPSPIRSAIVNGEAQTGVSIYRMNNKVDAGDILYQKKIQISIDDHYNDVFSKILETSDGALNFFLTNFLFKKLVFYKQQHENATYCKKISVKDGYLDFQKDSFYNLSRIRAFCNNPGAVIKLNNGLRYLIKKAKIADHPKNNKSMPFRKLVIGDFAFLSKKIIVKTLDGYIEIEKLQQEGKKVLDSSDFLNGWKGEVILKSYSLNN